MSENEREWQREREKGGRETKGLYKKKERKICMYIKLVRKCFLNNFVERKSR